jgi:hypothetical protein
MVNIKLKSTFCKQTERLLNKDKGFDNSVNKDYIYYFILKWQLFCSTCLYTCICTYLVTGILIILSETVNMTTFSISLATQLIFVLHYKKQARNSQITMVIIDTGAHINILTEKELYSYEKPFIFCHS